MRLRRYVVQSLNEKVTKTEIDEALMDPNITIGAEFEFIVDKLKNYQGNDLLGEYENAISDYEEYQTDYSEYQTDYKDIQKDIDRLTDKISDKEGEYEELDDSIGDDEEENDKITEKMTKLQYVIDELREQLEEKETELGDLEEPSPGSYYTDYFSTLRDTYGGYSSSRWWSNHEDYQEPPHPQDLGGYTLEDESQWLDAVRSMRHLWDTLPIPEDYKIKGYEHGDYNQWNLTYDSSIAENGGVELVSPPMNMFEFMKVVPEIFKWIDKHGSTDTSTGFHVHMGLKGIDNLEGRLDPIKTVMMTDEDYIWKFFDERKLNSYTKSMKGPLYERGIKGDDFKNLLNWTELKDAVGQDHYSAINFENWQEGHIEFRHMGGENYHRKFKEIMLIVARNAHALAVGVDPDYKRKEYITKLARMANKLNATNIHIATKIYELTIDRIKTRMENGESELKPTLKAYEQELKKYQKRMMSYSDVEYREILLHYKKESGIYDIYRKVVSEMDSIDAVRPSVDIRIVIREL